ncbi:hypothetical protein MSAN_02450500 [Mycena sanguinolenta]|uniref:Uncharacterized protein n=1 Tax=Mycena sanguinolenta TaxID=230812 RepID=A0A8H6WXU2_9AGAR|nr:hypothetical protein MSAN_02450500 [Mycena sanguinolenta]
MVQYHHICNWNMRRERQISFPINMTMNCGAVFSYSSQDLLDQSVEIASLSNAIYPHPWWACMGAVTEDVIENSWTRVEAKEAFNNAFNVSLSRTIDTAAWLSQANYVFRCLSIVFDFEYYVFLADITFQLNIPKTTGDPPMGFLFLCPAEDFRTGPSSFAWPACPAYWSLNPSGVDRLSMEEATQLGFPPLEIVTTATGLSWDASVYDGLRQFHRAKGFDPDSQGIARHLGHHLYQLSVPADVPAVDDVDDKLSCSGEDDLDTEGEDWAPGGEYASEFPTLHEEIPWEFKSIMGMKLLLILLLGLSWVYEHI